MKLQQGDYTEALTKKQFDELMEYQNTEFLQYYYEENSGICFSNYNFLRILRLSEDGEATNLLSFDEFKKRTINTFK